MLESRGHTKTRQTENYHFKWCDPLGCLVPLHSLLSSMVVLNHLNDQLQMAWEAAHLPLP